MKTFKITAVSLISLGSVAVLGSGIAAAHPGHNHGHHAKNAKVLVGTLDGYTAGTSAVINVNGTDMTVALNSHTKLTYKGTTSPTPAPTTGDAAAVNVRWHKGSAIAKRLAYGESAFQFAKGTFPGTYDAADSTTSTLVINGNGKKRAMLSFAITANTVYTQNGQPVSNPTLTNGERLVVKAGELTDGSWTANTVILPNS